MVPPVGRDNDEIPGVENEDPVTACAVEGIGTGQRTYQSAVCIVEINRSTGRIPVGIHDDDVPVGQDRDRASKCLAANWPRDYRLLGATRDRKRTEHKECLQSNQNRLPYGSRKIDVHVN